MKKLAEKHSIFIHKSLNGLADSLIKVFIPIIILKETQNIYLSLLFMALRPIFFVIFNNLLEKFLKKYPTVSIALHIVPIITIQVLIFFVELTLPIIILLGILMALFNTFYSVPFNLLFLFSDKKLNVSKMEIGTNLGRIIFIMIGGLIINSGTVSYLIALLVTASLFYIFSVLPLLFGSNLIKEYHAQKVEGNDVITKKEKTLLNVVHITFGSFQMLIDEILPVYLYFTGLTFASIALLQALIEMGKVVANLFAGKLYDKNLSRFSIVLFCGFYSVSAIVILLTKNTVLIYAVSALIGLSFPVIFVPIFKKFCQLTNGKSYVMEQVQARDNYIFAGKPFLVCSYFIGFTFISPFIFASLISATLAYSSVKLLNIKQTKSV